MTGKVASKRGSHVTTLLASAAAGGLIGIAASAAISHRKTPYFDNHFLSEHLPVNGHLLAGALGGGAAGAVLGYLLTQERGKQFIAEILQALKQEDSGIAGKIYETGAQIKDLDWGEIGRQITNVLQARANGEPIEEEQAGSVERALDLAISGFQLWNQIKQGR